MENFKPNSKKIQYLNILRILATYLVILLHCIAPFIESQEFYNTKTWWFCIVLNSLTRIAVPIFFMLSGFLLLNSSQTLNIKAFYKKRALRIVIPFIAWDIIYYIFYSVINQSKLSLLVFFKEFLVSGSAYHLWYIYAIVGIYLFIPFLKMIIDGCNTKSLIWLLAIVTFTTTTRPFINIITPFYIFLFEPIMNGYLGYVLLGYILGKTDLTRYSRMLFYLGGILGIFISVIGNAMNSSSQKIDLLFNSSYMLNHFLIASAIFVFFKYSKPIENLKINKIITIISSLTFTIYFIHILVLEVISKLFVLLGVVNIIRPITYIISCFVIVSMVSTISAFILSKIKYINKILI